MSSQPDASEQRVGGREPPEGEEPPINSETSSSSTSCSTTTTTTTTSAASTSSSTTSCSGDSSGNDDDGDDVDQQHYEQRHRHCHRSRDENLENNLNVGHVRNQSSAESQMCDTIARAQGSNLTILESSVANVHCHCQEEQHCCKCFPSIETVSSTTQLLLEQQQQVPNISKNQESNSYHDTQCQSVTSLKASTSSERHLDSDRPQILTPQHDLKPNRYSLSINPASSSLASSYSNLCSTTSSNLEPAIDSHNPSRLALKPAPSPSPSMSTIDTNNNKNSSTTTNNLSSSKEGLFNIKRNNFSKSASGSRLINKNRPNVCDCLSQDCGEKKHSTRRQFIEHYYNSRTQLPTQANTSTSSFNISTPLNKLSECDAITKRLLSSPIRSSNLAEQPTTRSQVSELDKSRRASLGTNTITDQVFLFSSNPFRSLELTYRKNLRKANNQKKFDSESGVQSKSSNSSTEKHQDTNKLKQQGRSLSICDEETLNPRHKGTSSNYSTNLNRAISLASESGTSSTTRRLLTIIPLFGCDIKSLDQFCQLGLTLPPVIDSAVEHILVNGINSIGIFRKSGVKSRILTLRQRIEANQALRIEELNQNNEFSIYDIADLVKMWFRELKPIPLMTKDLIKVISTSLNNSTIPQTSAATKRGNSSQQQDTRVSLTRANTTSGVAVAANYVDRNLRSRIDSMTSPTHKALLLRAMNFLALISSRCEVNQMTAQNLAICLTPSLCATDSDQNSILTAQKALEFCIENHQTLFDRNKS